MSLPAPSVSFPTTAWSCVEIAQNPKDPKFGAAATRLMTSYWRPVFHYLRAKGYSGPDAEDLTQEFFTQLWRGALGFHVREGQTRFRDALRVVVKRFAYDRTTGAKKQDQFERTLPRLSELVQDEDRTYEPTAGETPDAVFDRQWRQEVLANVWRNLEAHYRGTGSPDDVIRYAIFAAYHRAQPEATRPTRKDLATRFEKGRGFVQSALELVQKRYERFLRHEVREQVGCEEDVEIELRGLY